MSDLQKFKNWLSQRGCEILPITNQYEAVRFKGRETGVLYKSGKTSNQFTHRALRAFKTNSKWDGSPVNTGRHNNYKKEKEKLIERDGTKCFFCDKEMEDDITVEYLIALTAGGKNSLGNMVLAHHECNQIAGTMTVVQKVNLAIKCRNYINQ